ncbi:MAG TPA: DUF2330 domain-containing protein [Polyangiaceae bacterium]|nr:DUF2330 domain-containing protein [Polyangiaceae bacterium]
MVSSFLVGHRSTRASGSFGRPIVWACAFGGAWLSLNARDAKACGGCFHPPPSPQEVEASVVTDHRMVFSMSPAQSVLWDQIRYSGNPKDFAWVLPVRPGARIELSHDEWIAALEASTQTVITGPTPNCPGAPLGGGGGGGCAFGAKSSASFADGVSNAGGDLVDAGGVQVISQQVIGPYDAVTVRSSQGEALGVWLQANGYDIPASVQPTIDGYASAGFDFIALKLAPSQGVQAMQPVRIVTQGADPTLPLRMVAAGVGAHVGLELFVLSEGRYHPANFPDGAIDFTQLAWDPTQDRSNYSELAAQALAAQGGTAWLTESSQAVSLFSGGTSGGLAALYQATCVPVTFVPSCARPSTEASDDASADTSADASSDASGDASDEATGEASTDAASDGMLEATAAPDAPGDDGAASDGTASDGGVCGAVMVTPCDDFDLAMTGIVPGSLWVTRLRADLPVAALATDLQLEATASQTPVSNVHHTDKFTVAHFDPCAANGASPRSSSSNGGCGCRAAESAGDRFGGVATFFLAACGLVLSMRRRRR